MTSFSRSRTLLAALVLAFPLVAAVASTAAADVNESSAASLVDAQRRISIGNLHSCAITDDGAVACWGSNDNGQLGNGTTTTTTKPVPVSGVSAAVQLAAGGSHTCVLVYGGTVRCWGHNGNGQLGSGSTDNAEELTPVSVTGIGDATAIAAGGFHSCAIVAAGAVKCWGSDGMGQLGDGNPGDSSASPVLVAGLSGVVALALGEFHSCALTDTGAVKCWGHNGFGQLGDGTKTDRSSPVAVAGLPDPADDPVLVLTTGASHSCVLLDDDDRTVRCWGHNAYGSLGHATAVVDSVMQPSVVPLTVRYDADPDPLIEDLEPVAGVTSLTSGQFHSCARITGGTLRCWGNNHRGQLGTNPPGHAGHSHGHDSVNALVVPGVSGVEAVTAGGFHTCVLDGTALSCWGYNFYGQLGGHRNSNPSPVTVTALTGATAVTAGTDFACALANSAITDQPVCWGSNSDGRLGAGLGVPHTTVRVPVSGLTNADAIDAGNGHACALPADSGSPQCWGLGGNGQLGNGGNSSASAPVNVSGLTTADTVSAGGALGSAERGTSCAVRTDGKVSCWGRNANGQLGDGTTDDRNTPVTVQIDTDPDPDVVALADLTGAAEVVTGGFHGCARMTDSSVRCWGFNGSGQLGDATNTQRLTAVRVQTDTDPDEDVPLTGALALSAGESHTCARLTGDAVKCWGLNSSGQLGDGTTTARNRPTAVPALDGSVDAKKAKLITAGDFHSCATRTDGAMVCWGSDSHGQLGNGAPLSNSSSPVVAFPAPEESEAIPFVTSISGSRHNTCARLIDHTVSCWGDNTAGQNGDGIGTHSLAPVSVLNLGSVGGNHIPSPGNDTADTDPDTPVDVDVLANDTDADGDTLTVVSVADPAHGTTSGTGPVTYTPDAGYCGDDTFTYVVTDGTADVPATVTITMNCPPVAVNDVAMTNEDVAVGVPVLDNDTDPDGDGLSVTSVADPPRGTASHDGTTVTYTPDADECGAPYDTFTYEISDGHGHTASATLTVAVACGNDGPVAVDDAVATPEGEPVVVGVLDNDSDVDADDLSVSAVTDPAHGTATTNGATVTYTPDADYCGADTFDYTASDGTLTDTGTVTVAVTCVADSPKALDDVATVAEDGSTTVNVLGNDTDPDGDTLSVASVTDPAHGTATVNGSGTVDYQPDADYCGNDTFSYVASDGTLTDTATVEVSVTCVNDAPVATDDAAATPEDTVVHVHVLTNDTDVDGDELSVTGASDPAHGSTTVEDGAVAYTPDADWCGSDTFDYTVKDPSGATDTATVAVTVECVNDPPSIHPVSDRTGPWGDLVATTLGVSDVDAGDSHTYALVSGPVGASVSTGGEFGWTPTASQVGAHTVVVKVTDSGGAASQTSFTVTVTKRTVSVAYDGAGAGQYSDPAAVSASVTDTSSGVPVAGLTIGFTIGSLTASATTDAAGDAATSMLLLGPTGDTTVKAAFNGSAAYAAASDTDPFAVAKETITTRFTGQHLTAGSSSPVTLTASVTEQADGYLGSALATTKVTFTQVGGGVLCTAMVSVSGPGTGTASCATAALPAGSRAVVVTAASPAYAGKADVTAFTVAAPVTGDAAGSGQAGTGDDFGFAVTVPKKGGPTGDAIHVFTDGNTAYVVSSSAITSVTRNCTGGSPKVCTVTVVAGSASTVAVDLTTGTVSAVAGSSTLTVTATDGAPDAYGVQITGSTPYTLGSGPLSHGDVRVPS